MINELVINEVSLKYIGNNHISCTLKDPDTWRRSIREQKKLENLVIPKYSAAQWPRKDWFHRSSIHIYFEHSLYDLMAPSFFAKENVLTDSVRRSLGMSRFESEYKCVC